MNFGIVQRIIALLLILYSLTMLPPIGVSLIYHDQSLRPFLLSFAIILTTGFLAWWPVRRMQPEPRLRDGFLIVALFWFVLGIIGALPLWLAQHPQISFTDAAFESISGLTTTGATMLTGLDKLPKSILYYRQQVQWFGGMGIIVLAVAVLPMLGVGGMQLYRAETPGPTKDKLTPRVTETAKALWLVYMGLTLACALAYWLAGMSLFDAIGHSFSTLATGGFSTHDASMGYFNSPLIDLLSMFFMFLAGVNFSLHFVAFRRMSVTTYWRDTEFMTYLKYVLVLIAIVTAYLLAMDIYPTLPESFVQGGFQVVSYVTSTGFTTTDSSVWPGLLPVLLIMSTVVGGCGGSTAGGIKVARAYLLFKQGSRELARLVHPSAQIPVKMGGKPVAPRVLDSIWAFFAAYVALFTLMVFVLLLMGIDSRTAFSAVATCINNLGPGLGKVTANFQAVNNSAKWVLIFAMLLGRLELFTLLVLVTPAFWRR